MVYTPKARKATADHPRKRKIPGFFLRETRDDRYLLFLSPARGLVPREGVRRPACPHGAYAQDNRGWDDDCQSGKGDKLRRILRNLMPFDISQPLLRLSPTEERQKGSSWICGEESGRPHSKSVLLQAEDGSERLRADLRIALSSSTKRRHSREGGSPSLGLLLLHRKKHCWLNHGLPPSRE